MDSASTLPVSTHMGRVPRHNCPSRTQPPKMCQSLHGHWGCQQGRAGDSKKDPGGHKSRPINQLWMLSASHQPLSVDVESWPACSVPCATCRAASNVTEFMGLSFCDVPNIHLMLVRVPDAQCTTRRNSADPPNSH